MVIDPGTVLPALIGAAATVIGALLVWLSKRSDKATQTLDLALKNLGERVAEQDAKITRLTERLDASEKDRRQQAVQIRDLQDRERDREELLADYREHTHAYQMWADDGGVPPSPTWSWRIAADQKDYTREKEVG
ncbi:hypothetical protein [Kocuria rhizophila]|uniref:hypothetical protein n=1 Tax=Kocuria rhizophila TaxID=72000 RepID=UPI0021A5E884|nr:hypothetical protein [Kocuria rhizophila]MCT2249362.1 hypothetical protein [Kocuria rhizophila]